MMFLTSSILLGFIRLSFIILFLFYLNRKFVNVARHVNFLDFIISNWFRYGSIILIIIFTLVQLNAYNLFNCFFLLAIIIGIDIIGIENLRKPRHYFNTTIKSSLLTFLRNVEHKKSFWFWISFDRRKTKKNRRNTLILVLTILIGSITFLSRYYFIIYDNYSLSDAWIYDLGKVIESDSQIWFSNELTVDGEFAMTNFYGKITDVSPEIALQVIAILESTLLALILFWTINKVTPSKFLAPIIASFSFALVYVLTPLDVYFLLKANPIFFALTLALPAFVYFLKPGALRVNKISYFLSFVLAFIAIGLIDFFTACVLVPPFLIIGLIFTKYKYKAMNLRVLLAFLLGSGILFLLYTFACYYDRGDIMEFFQTNLLSVSSYTYVPQLIIPYEEIVRYAQYSTFVGFFLVLLLMIFNKENWRSTIVFFVYFNFLIVLTYINNEWLDIDMLKSSLSVFLPIILGLNAAIVIRILNFVFYRWERFTPVTVTLMMIGMIYASIFYQQRNINSLTEADKTPKQILDAYDKIGQTFFPWSYCVVNDPATQVISTNKHFFMNYDYFLDEYQRIDSINTKHKKDPKFLIKNPEYSLSKSVLVFVLNDKGKDENNMFSLNKQLRSSLIGELDQLRKKGRKVNLFYESKVLNVYEIVNEPKESKTSDLIF
jgi:hypothetical protein